jgi:hypothetical protein
MANNRWLSKAAPVKQVDTVTIALTWAQGDTITLTIDGVDFIVTIGTLVTTTQVATTLKQAFNGETLTDTAASYSVTGGAITLPHFRDITASASSSVVTFTQSTASYALFPGKPWTMTAVESTVGNGTATLANATTPISKYHANNVDNFSNAAAFANNDVAIFDSGAGDCLYQLSTGVQPATFIHSKGFTGKIGLAPFNADNQGYTHREYRTRYLTFTNNSVTTTANYAQGEGSGSGRIYIDHGAGRWDHYCWNQLTRENSNIPAICLKGTHVSSTLTNLNSDVGYAFFSDESGHLASVRNGNGKNSQAKTILGSGVDLGDATIVCDGGTLEINSTTTTSSSIVVNGGTLIVNAGNHLTITVNAGTVLYRSPGSTLATLVIGPEGEFVKDMPGNVAITNAVQMHKGAKIRAADGNITLNAGVKLNYCRPADVTLDLGPNWTYSLA